MKSPKVEVIRKVIKWLSFGDDDLRLARHGLKMGRRSPYRLVAYHAQQCAEKHIKAYLVYKGVDFPYTHNISRLLELCGDQVGWVKDMEDAEELTPFAITTRYPSEEEEVTRKEALRAIEIAVQVRRKIRNVLAKEGMQASKMPKG